VNGGHKVLDHYFCSFAGETFPNRLYQHAARTDRDHNTTTISKLPAIWDQLSPIPNNQGIPTGGYFFRDLPFLALWGLKYYPFWHLFAAGDTDVLGIPVTTPFVHRHRGPGTAAQRQLRRPGIRSHRQRNRG